MVSYDSEKLVGKSVAQAEVSRVDTLSVNTLTETGWQLVRGSGCGVKSGLLRVGPARCQTLEPSSVDGQTE